MKVIRKIIKFILNSIIIIAMSSILLSINSKEIFYDLIYTYAFKPAIKNETEQLINSKVEDEQINELLDNEETKKLINSYIDSTISNLASDEEIDDNVIDKFIDYIKENKEEFEETLNVKISDEEINSLKSTEAYNELVNNYKESIKKSKDNMPQKEKSILRIYNFLVSKDIRLLLIGIIIICTILSALVEWSPHKWIQDTGANILTTGLMLLAMSLTVEYYVNKAITNLDITFSTKGLTKCAIITTITGMAIMLIYGLVKKIFSKKESIEKE